jgi:tripartite-type tricarboxylate transporter receptor subunit TctC
MPSSDRSFARYLRILCAWLVFSGVSCGVSAQTYRILVPAPAGNGADVAARAIAEHIKGSFPGPVIMDNRPGALGRVAVDHLKRAPTDGTTILFAPIVIPVINPLVTRHLNYDPATDLVPISQIGRYELALAVPAHHPARSIQDYVAWAKTNPDRATLGTIGTGSLPHLLGLMLGRTAGVPFTFVPYTGFGALQVDLVSGDLSAGIGAVGELLAFHRGGKVRILATSGGTRSRQMPEAPTLVELGYTGVEATGWVGLYAPAGTPRRAIDQWAGAVNAALRTTELKAAFAVLDLEPTGTSPEELAAIAARDTKHWRAVIQATGFAAE